MTRNEAISRLRDSAPMVRAMGATSLYLYGSTARDEARPDSDIDLVVEYDPEGSFNALDLVGIKQLLEVRLGTPIDVTTRDGLHPRLKTKIETSAVRIF